MKILYLSSVWLKSSPILSRISDCLSRPWRSLIFGLFVRTTAQLYAILPIDADLDPRCGVPRKQMLFVAGAMLLRRVPMVDADLFRASLTMMPPRL